MTLRWKNSHEGSARRLNLVLAVVIAAQRVVHARAVAVPDAHRLGHDARRGALGCCIALGVQSRQPRLARRPDLGVLAGVPVETPLIPCSVAVRLTAGSGMESAWVRTNAQLRGVDNEGRTMCSRTQPLQACTKQPDSSTEATCSSICQQRACRASRHRGARIRREHEARRTPGCRWPTARCSSCRAQQPQPRTPRRARERTRLARRGAPAW